MTIRQAKEEIANIINNSGLGIDVIELMVEGLLAEVRLATDRAYAEAAKKEQEKNKDGEADEPTESDVC